MNTLALLYRPMLTVELCTLVFSPELRMVMDDLLRFWPEFDIDYTPMFNIPYSCLPLDLKVPFNKSIEEKCFL